MVLALLTVKFVFAAFSIFIFFNLLFSFFIMFDHCKSYASAYALVPDLLKYRLQLTNGMPLSDYNKLLTVYMICLSMSISSFRRSINAVCCKVITRCFQRLDSRCQWNGTEGDWHISVGLSQPHYAAGWQFDSRCQLAGQLHVALTTPFVTDLRHPLSTCRQLTAV